MIEVAEIIRAALALWQMPSFTELSPEDITDATNRVLAKHFLALDLTPDACFAAQNTRIFRFSSVDQREKAVDAYIDDASRVLRVESRLQGSTVDDDWREESVASYENWNDVKERRDDNFVAFYGIPGEVKMVVTRDVSGLEFRIIYQVLREAISTLDQLLGLPDHYRTVLTYDIAIEFGHIIDNFTPEFMAKRQTRMPYLTLRYEEALDLIDKWRRSQKGTSITQRRAFNDRRYSPRPGIPDGLRTAVRGPREDDEFLTE